MLLPFMSTSSMGEQMKTSPVSNYVAVGEAIPSSRQRKSQVKGGSSMASEQGWVPIPTGTAPWCHGDALDPLSVLTSSSLRSDSSWYLSLNSGLYFWSRSVSTFFKSCWASFASF